MGPHIDNEFEASFSRATDKLYPEENEKMQNCPICNASKWKDLKTKGKKVANKPLIRELQTLWSGVWTRDDVTDNMNQLRVLPRRITGKHSSNKQKPCDRNVEFNWNKRSIFYDLEYWPTLQLKHNLDVMHIEKNVLESLLGTLLMNGKSKDTIKARQDLEDWGIRKDLWLVEKGSRKFKKPHPKYTFTPDNRKNSVNSSKELDYLMEEALTFCSYYIKGVETRFNRPDRNGFGLNPTDTFQVFQSVCELVGKEVYTTMNTKVMQIVVWFILNNSPEIDAYIDAYKKEFLNNNLEAEFPRWFDLQICQKSMENDPWCSPESELFSLACGPESNANSYAACVVNSVKFLVHDRDIHRTTHNSGVATPGPNGEMFYGQLEEILELTYISNRKGINHILTDKDSYRDEQYILATHARQVFYLEDLARRPPHWKDVEDVHHRKIWHRDVVEDNQDVIHDSKSSDVALSTNLGDLDYTSLSTNDESTKVDTSPDNEVPDEESADFIGDEDDVVPHVLED
nr:hypothetical protein [Tanacetum cinerariifolium]